jgi:hypothetical protein
MTCIGIDMATAELAPDWLIDACDTAMRYRQDFKGIPISDADLDKIWAIRALAQCAHDQAAGSKLVRVSDDEARLIARYYVARPGLPAYPLPDKSG